MDRNVVLEVVLRHLTSNVDGIDPRVVDPSRSMGDYGATSVDMFEVVVASGRELGIRVPRTRLVHCKNLNALVDLFCSCAEEARASA